MEIIGKPGEEVWVKAKIHLINITEDGITYYVKMDESGQAFEKKEEEIIAAAPKNIKEPAKTGAAQTGKKRGRPRKATVEDLVERAKGERPQKIEILKIPDSPPTDVLHELVKKDDLKRRTGNA